MAKIQKLGLIATLTFLSATALPGPSGANAGGSGWYGVESFDSVVYLDSQIVSRSHGSNIPADLNVSYSAASNGAYLSIYIYSYNGFSFDAVGEGSGVNVDPSGDSGGLSVYGGSSAIEGNFFDGVADITFTLYDPDAGTFDVGFVGFQATPEPSSLVLAATGLLMALVYAWKRRCFPVSVR